MKIFMIICNPKEHSLKEELVKTYTEEASKKGHEVKTLNLYDLNIDFLRENDGKFDYSLTPELQQAQNDVLWADHLVFVYPIWWFGIPALMKSFLEKVFVENVVSKYGKMGPEPLMKDKTAVIIQSYDMPYWCMKYVYADVPMKWWKVVLTSWCGPKIIKRFDFDMIGSASEEKKQKWIKDIKKFVAKL